MHNIELVPFTDKYVDDVLKISTLSFHTPWTKESLFKELENDFARYILVKDGDLILGFGGIWIIVDEAHVTNIAVHPEYRGTGIGSLVMEGLIEICKIEHLSSMTLEVRKSNLVAQNLYKKFDFVEEGIRKGYYDDTKEDAIIMWKRDIKWHMP